MTSLVSSQFDLRPPFWKAASVGEYDDYFTEDKESDWTAVAVTGTITWNYNSAARLGQNRGVMAVYEDQSVDDWPSYLKPLSGIAVGDYIQTSVQMVKRPGSEIASALLVLTDGTATSSNMVAWGAEISAAEAGANLAVTGTLTGPSAFPINETLFDGWPGEVHLRLEYDAANSFIAWWSLNGEDWAQVGAAISKTMTPTHGGFAISSYGAGNLVHSHFRYFHTNVTS